MSDDLDAPGPRTPAVRPGAIACPVCSVTGPLATRIGAIGICGACGASLVLDMDGSVRRATALDLDHLMPRDRALLVKARSAIARPKA